MIKMRHNNVLFVTFSLCLLLSSVSARRSLLQPKPGGPGGGGAVFDVTNPKYGGKPGTDIMQALGKAWAEACAAPTPSKVLIPKGTFLLKFGQYKGPCKAHITFQLDGVLRAPAYMNQIPNKEWWINFNQIDGLTVAGSGTFDGNGQTAWKMNDCKRNPQCGKIPSNVRFDKIKNGLLRGITTLNSKYFHIFIFACQRFTVQNIRIIAPDESPNTDGIHLGRSTGINITDSFIGTGDDCISIGDGTKQLIVNKVHCGPGHGISVGSLGRYPNEEHVAGLRFTQCNFTGTQNGVRIKTFPNSNIAITASDIHFDGMIMKDVYNPIFIDQGYCLHPPCKKPPANPSKVKISNVSFKNIKGTTKSAEGLKILCAKGIGCDKVVLSDIDLKLVGKGVLTSRCTSVQPTITRVIPALACQQKT